MLAITKLLHVSLLVADVPRALAFYHGVLGLQVSDERPDLDYPGAWLQLGEQQIHLLQLPNPDPITGRPTHGGRDRHTALAVTNIELLKQALDQASIPYTLSKSGRPALFCRDPDGNALEFVRQA